MGLALDGVLAVEVLMVWSVPRSHLLMGCTGRGLDPELQLGALFLPSPGWFPQTPEELKLSPMGD